MPSRPVTYEHHTKEFSAEAIVVDDLNVTVRDAEMIGLPFKKSSRAYQPPDGGLATVATDPSLMAPWRRRCSGWL